MDKNEQETHSHPSYGMLRFGRVNGHAKFFGSELNQNHYISLTLNPGEVTRDLSKEWYYGKPFRLMEVRMSANQFAELISSLNYGSGVPCTIEYINGVEVEKLPSHESRKEFIHRKFQDRMEMFSDKIKNEQLKAKNLVKKKTLSKEDQRELLQTLEWLSTEISSNIPFFAECFQETMDEVVAEAKSEVENAIQHKITTAGLETLLNQQNKFLTNE